MFFESTNCPHRRMGSPDRKTQLTKTTPITNLPMKSPQGQPIHGHRADFTIDFTIDFTSGHLRPQLPRQSQHQRWRIQRRRPLRTCAVGGATGVVGVDAPGTASSGSRATTHGSGHRPWWGWMVLKDFYGVFFLRMDVKYNQSIFYTHHILIVITTPPPPPPPRTLAADPKHCILQCFCAFGMDKVLLATC